MEERRKLALEREDMLYKNKADKRFQMAMNIKKSQTIMINERASVVLGVEAQKSIMSMSISGMNGIMESLEEEKDENSDDDDQDSTNK